MLKNSITVVYSHKYIEMKINSDDGLPFKNISTLIILVVLVKSVFDKNHSLCYYQTF